METETYRQRDRLRLVYTSSSSGVLIEGALESFNSYGLTLSMDGIIRYFPYSEFCEDIEPCEEGLIVKRPYDPRLLDCDPTGDVAKACCSVLRGMNREVPEDEYSKMLGDSSAEITKKYNTEENISTSVANKIHHGLYDSGLIEFFYKGNGLNTETFVRRAEKYERMSEEEIRDEVLKNLDREVIYTRLVLGPLIRSAV